MKILAQSRLGVLLLVHIDMAKWGQNLEDLRRASRDTPHRRSRERFQARYLIASGRFNATTCAAPIGRQDATVLVWVHRDNELGPDALTSRRTGGRAPFLIRAGGNRSATGSRPLARSTTAGPATAGP
jgi:hypothetical protein